MNGNDRDICGIDIGGANLKYATADGRAWAEPFAMWRDANKLAERLRQTLYQLLDDPQNAILGITMTAELADCFATRREGVVFLLDQVRKAYAEASIYVYAVGDIWKSALQAKQDPWSVAASNWYGLTQWLARVLKVDPEKQRSFLVSTPASEAIRDSVIGSAERGVLVDIGSTTVDVVPFANGLVLTDAQTDRQRLQAEQLLYTGIERTPIGTILGAVDVEGKRCPLMAERFAESQDVYLILGQLAEQNENYDTADGRNRTRENAAARLARMVGEDLETLSLETVTSIAEQVAAKQLEKIVAGVSRNLRQVTASKTEAGPCSLVFSGHGRFLNQAIIDSLLQLLSLHSISRIYSETPYPVVRLPLPWHNYCKRISRELVESRTWDRDHRVASKYRVGFQSTGLGLCLPKQRIAGTTTTEVWGKS